MVNLQLTLRTIDETIAGDGRVNPVDACMALVKGARQQGVRVHEGVAVADVLSTNGRVRGVRTECGQEIRAEYVVNCAGMWARYSCVISERQL